MVGDLLFSLCFVCVCVCVRARVRERERERGGTRLIGGEFGRSLKDRANIREWQKDDRIINLGIFIQK
jgi:hypothetical protein